MDSKTNDSFFYKIPLISPSMTEILFTTKRTGSTPTHYVNIYVLSEKFSWNTRTQTTPI